MRKNQIITDGELQLFSCFLSLSSYFKEAKFSKGTSKCLFSQGLASNWDLDMFREAQARASKVGNFKLNDAFMEKPCFGKLYFLVNQGFASSIVTTCFVQVIEEQLKGLPDVKGTKYMEMGRHQMEVFYFVIAQI